MTDKELTEWEHQSYVLNVLTSREMGAWLGRRDNRLLQEIRQEIIDNSYPIVHGINNHEQGMTVYGIMQIIDKHIKAESEDKE